MKRSILKLKKIAVIFSSALILLCLFSVSASAESMSDMPYVSYTYWEGYTNKTAVTTKMVYRAMESYDGNKLGVGAFSEIQQVFSEGNFLYVVDSGNGRIVKLDSAYNMVEIIDSVIYNEEKITFNGFRGIFVYGDELYIADTENERLLCCRNGEVFRIITKPESTAIPEDFLYVPVRVIKDNNGYLYVLCDGSYYGTMVFSDKYEFIGFFGANTVNTTVFGAIKDFITSAFETEEKHNASVQALPYQIMDMCIDSEGFICAVNNDDEGQIRRFGTDGTNILVHTDQFDSSSADSFNFGDFPIGYVDTTSKYGSYIKQSFIAIAADSEGYIYAVDTTQGRIFMYDNKCNLINVFGGGVSAGNQDGTFVTANSVAVFGDDLIVSDFANGKFTVFRLTDYGRTLKQANVLTNSGKHIEAEKYWLEINLLDKNCQLAYKGLAKAALQRKDYKAAMEYAETGLDRVTYAEAFKYVRNEFIGKNFWWIALLAVALVGAMSAFLIVSKRRQIIFIKNEKLRTAMDTVIHPIESFNKIKFKGMASPIISTVILLLFYVTAVSQKLNGGFMFGIVNTASYNAIFTLIGTVGVMLLWIIINWVVCMLAEGKGSIWEVYCTACYCLIPKIVYYLLYIILSHVTVASSNASFGILSAVCTLFMIILLLLSMTVVQEYTFFKAMGMAIVTVLGMAVGAFVIFVVLTLGQDLIGFVISIVREIVLR